MSDNKPSTERVEPAPQVPADIVKAIIEYGDARADHYFRGGAARLHDVIGKLRVWAASLQQPREPAARYTLEQLAQYAAEAVKADRASREQPPPTSEEPK